MDKDTYSFTVTFDRSLSADLEVIGRHEDDLYTYDVRHELMQQLRTELQAAYDDPNVSPDGSFTINSITIDGTPFPCAVNITPRRKLK